MKTNFALFTDGATFGPNPSSLGGSWAWCIVDLTKNKVVKRRSGIITPPYYNMPVITNNLMETMAVIYGLEELPDEWSGTVYTDSMVNVSRIKNKNTIDSKIKAKVVGITRKNCSLVKKNALLAKANKGKNWRGVPPEIRKKFEERIENLGEFEVKYVKGHPTQEELQIGIGSIYNVICDELCLEQERRSLGKGGINAS